MNTSALPAPRSSFRFKPFQSEDYARIALHDGGILGHDPGGGKTNALFVLPALKCGFRRDVKRLEPLQPVLQVAPEDLHDNAITEGRNHFKAQVTKIYSQADFLNLSSLNPVTGQRVVPPGYYITSYTQLCSNGVRDFPAFDRANWRGMMSQLGMTERDGIKYYDRRGEIYARQYTRLHAQPEFSLEQLQRAYDTRRTDLKSVKQQAELDEDFALVRRFAPPRPDGEFNDLAESQQADVLSEMTAYNYLEYVQSIGSARWYTPPAAKVAVKGIHGRVGEENEFVEFKTGIRTLVAQRVNDSQFWTVFDTSGDTFKVVEAGLTKPAAIAQAEALAQSTNPVIQSSGHPASAFKVKCVYDPTLADLCQDAFACTVIDEGVKMKGEDTEIGLGVRQMTSAYRYVLTGTPIKNRLPDVFRLAWWTTGGKPDAHARFPYPDSSMARDAFAAEFLVSESNRSKSNRKKLTPQVCNIHRLWKLFAPVILRRRKADFGENIVAKTRHVVRVPMGKQQAAVYKFHLDAVYLDCKLRPAMGPKLQALRIAAANPCSRLLHRPEHDRKTEGPERSLLSHIPKLHAALQLVQEILARGEQVVIFSAFIDSTDAISARLTEAGVKHCTLDGRVSPANRSTIAAQFKLGPPKAGKPKSSPYPVMLAGIESMAEGHSFHLCNNVILLAYSWAYDKFEQAINRVHRLNSVWDVNVYAILCDGSIDRKLEANIQEKGDAAELVLDGKLLGENTSEVNYAELLQIARDEFVNNVTVDENELAVAWPALRLQLTRTMLAWARTAPVLLPSIPVAATVTTNNAPVETDTVTVTPAHPPSSTIHPPRVTTPRPSVPRSVPAPVRKDFEDLALWKQAKLPARPLPFDKRPVTARHNPVGKVNFTHA